MNFRTKQIGTTFSISALMLAGIVNAQSIQDGLNYLDNDQFSKAKETFQGLISQAPTADNYYYLGYYYLKTGTPNIELASQNFNKGLEADPKSNLNKIGLATIKLYQKNKAGANTDFEALAKATKYKNAEVLYKIADAYVLFKSKPESMDPDKSVAYSQKLLELVKNRDKAEYYITLGNAYYQKLDAGKAMTNYSKALEIADSKALTYTLIANIWGRSNNSSNNNNALAKENFNKAIAANPNSAITYKYLSEYNIRNYEYNEATKNLQKYIELTGNDDAGTQLNLANIAYYGKDYDKTISILDKSWNAISDPLKYKIKALALIEKSNPSEAYKNMDQYFQTVPESAREGSDYGVLGKIQTLLIPTIEGAEKEQLIKEAVANLTQAQTKGDKVYDYQALLLGLKGNTETSGVGTATNSKIETLKKAVIANASDTKSWYELALEQYAAKDYVSSITSWDKLIELIPTWETAYAGKAMALYAHDTSDQSGLAGQTYQKYIDLVEPKKEYSETEKAYLSIAYTFFAYNTFHAGDKVKAQEYLDKVLVIDPQNTDALNLQGQLKK